MPDLYDLLQQIEAKPGLYIGEPSISHLYMFLSGYQFARRQMKLPLSPQEETFRTFQLWLQQLLNRQTSASWAQLPLAESNDEAEAFERFYPLWRRFLQETHALNTANGQGMPAINGSR